jgi:hypothetical protein
LEDTFPAMASTFVNFHQQMEHLQALLAAAASSGNKIGNYDIRQCLRQIQSCLLREQGDLLYEQNNDEEVTRDLMILLTLNDEYADPMILELMNALIHRAAELIACYGGELSTDQLQSLLARVLYIVQDPQGTPAFDSLVQLLNQHLPSPRISEVLEDNDHDCWIALQIILTNQQQSSGRPTTHLSLSVFTLALLEYLATNVLPQYNATFHSWIQSQLLWQRTYSSSTEVEQHVREYREMIEQYGVYLVEYALHLLEQGAHCEGAAEDSDTLLALQYSTVATDFVHLFQSNKELSSCFVLAFSGMTKSLWQALTYFVVHQLEENPENVSKELQMAATEALWKLTFSATTNANVALDGGSSSMIVVTVLRLLQHPDYFWTSEAQEWLNDQLTTTSYRRSLCHALQATIISLLSDYPGTSQKEHISSFIQMVLSHCDNSGDGELVDDPWQSLVEEYLSDHLMMVQEAMPLS